MYANHFSNVHKTSYNPLVGQGSFITEFTVASPLCPKVIYILIDNAQSGGIIVGVRVWRHINFLTCTSGIRQRYTTRIHNADWPRMTCYFTDPRTVRSIVKHHERQGLHSKLMSQWPWGPCKVRNETETKRNETKQIETKRNKSKRNETDRNETKQIETKRNETKRNKSKRNETNDMANHCGQKSFFLILEIHFLILEINFIFENEFLTVNIRIIFLNLQFFLY